MTEFSLKARQLGVWFNHPLIIALDAAVPLRILLYQQRGGPTTEDWERVQAFAPILAEHGDNLLYVSKTRDATSRIFNSLADAIATLAFCPGGVKLFGRHWEASRTPQEAQPI